jgi:WD40 repeat protein
LVATAAFAPAADSYTDARLKDLGVEMVLDTPGRTGACDVLRFTSDGKHLLAAGDDKVVRVWDCGDGGLTPADVTALRWSMFREQRGGIYALDVTPDPARKDGFRVVIAGVGLRTAGAAVLDDRGKVLYGLPRFTPEQEEAAKTVKAIWSVAFDSKGERVALGGSDGSVWLWNLRGNTLSLLGRVPAEKRDPPSELNEIRLVAFAGPDRLVCVASNGWALQWDLAARNPGPKPLFRFDLVKNLVCAAVDPTGQWLAAGGQTLAEGERSSWVELRSVDGSQHKTLELPSRNFPKRVAFDAASRRLAVGTYVTDGEADFYLLTGGGTFIFDVSEANPKAVPGPKTSWYVDAVAFHPDGRRFAVGGGDNQEVTLWDLRRPGEAPISRIAGPGRGLWGVGVSADFRYLGFRDQRNPQPTHPNGLGRGEWHVFNLVDRRFANPKEAKEFKPVQPLREADGWTVKSDKVQGNLWYVVKGDVEQPVPLMPQDKLPRCYTFLKRDDDHPTRLVVGHIWGMSVYALGDGPPKLVRKFAGHQGEVMSVAPSADNKFLVTASRDQTLAVWSLQPQQHQDELGADFEVKGKRLVVKNVAAGSPAWEAHLQAGDEVTAFASNGPPWIKGGPEKWLPILKAPPPGLECAFHFDRAAAPFATLTTVRQRPLARFFPMGDREWVLWRYYDFYYDCSTNGDRFVAWQLSGDIDKTPRFDPLERYRKRFFKPEKVASLFADVADTPERVSLLDIEAPRLTFVANPEKVSGGEVQLSISARPAGNLPEQQVKQVTLWVNGAVAREWMVKPTDEVFRDTLGLPADQLRRGKNILTVQAYNRAEIRRETEVVIECDRPPTKPNLFALVVGVGKYERGGSAGGDPLASGDRTAKLQVLKNLSANKDARAVERMLAAQKQLFAKTEVIPLVDDDATRERILEETARIAKAVRPDDTFVLFLGGHGASGQVINGLANSRDVKLPKPISPHLFVFCTHDFALDKPLITGLPSEDLYREIRRLNCRSVVLIDACHSGTIVEDPVRQLSPDGVGPVILSAAGPREAAVEDHVLGDQYTQGRANGLFTIALLLAVEREFRIADANHDRVLTASELFDFLQGRVAELLKAGGAGDEGQHPTGSLPKLEKEMPVAAR